MSKYTISKVSKNAFLLEEKASSNIIATFSSWEEARVVSRFFTKGGAFNGWTPNFILGNRPSINKTTQQHDA